MTRTRVAHDFWRLRMKQFPTPLLVAALLAFGAARLAADTDANETFPSAISTVNPCNGEVVALTGENHLLVHTTEPTSGNFELYFDLSSNYVGTGLTTGVGYQGSEDIFNSFSLQNPFPLVFVL